jgi:hypothetical protein
VEDRAVCKKENVIETLTLLDEHFGYDGGVPRLLVQVGKTRDEEGLIEKAEEKGSCQARAPPIVSYSTRSGGEDKKED